MNSEALCDFSSEARSRQANPSFHTNPDAGSNFFREGSSPDASRQFSLSTAITGLSTALANN